MNQSENIHELAGALAKAQGEMTPVYKDKKVAFDTKQNDKVKYKYADLASCYDACRTQLSKNEIAITQPIGVVNGMWVITTVLTHSSGQWMSSMLPINITLPPTALGSLITYMRRYTLCAMVGLAPEDDDAQAASREYENIPCTNKGKPEMNTSSDKIGLDQIALIASLVSKLTDDSYKSFFNWIKVKFNAINIPDIPVEGLDSCMSKLNVTLKYLKDQEQNKMEVA